MDDRARGSVEQIEQDRKTKYSYLYLIISLVCLGIAIVGTSDKKRRHHQQDGADGLAHEYRVVTVGHDQGPPEVDPADRVGQWRRSGAAVPATEEAAGARAAWSKNLQPSPQSIYTFVFESKFDPFINRS